MCKSVSAATLSELGGRLQGEGRSSDATAEYEKDIAGICGRQIHRSGPLTFKQLVQDAAKPRQMLRA